MCAYQFPRLPGTSEVQAEPTEEDEGLGVGELFLEEGERPSKGHALPADVEELAKEWSFSEAEEDAGKAVPELADGDPEGECVPADQVPEGGSQETSEEREREASEPFEFSVAYFVRPLRSRRSGDALRALQEVYIDLKMLGLPVNRLHADRAREF